MASRTKSKSTIKRKWPCKTFQEHELSKFNGSGFRLYLSDPDRVDFGEMLFWRIARRIPDSITPNFLTRCGLFGNLLIFLIAFVITPALDHEMGEWAAQYVPSIICILLAVLQFTVSALDNFDGLHARGSGQCSDLGALLDHYFDSISVAMNSVAMVMMLDGPPSVCILGAICGPMIFNLQLLTNHYLNEEPRVIGPEAQMMCCVVMLMVSVLFYYRFLNVVWTLSIIVGVITCCSLIKYLVTFTPRLWVHAMARVQLALFWSSYAVICVLYCAGFISTFELCLLGVYISWDFNGQIVTHYVLQETLPIFAPWYWLTVGVVAEYYVWNPLLWLVDSKNNIHLTTIALWLTWGIA